MRASGKTHTRTHTHFRTGLFVGSASSTDQCIIFGRHFCVARQLLWCSALGDEAGDDIMRASKKEKTKGTHHFEMLLIVTFQERMA